jgi:periplasmic protein TonB
MRDPKKGKSRPASTAIETALGRCLVEGDSDVTWRARRARSKAFGASLALEAGLVALLVAVPLFTSVAQPNFSRPKSIPFVWSATRPNHTMSRPSTPVHNPLNGDQDAITYNTNFHPRQPVQTPVPDVAPPIPIQEPSSGEHGSGPSIFVDLRPAGPVAPPHAEIKKNEDRHPLKLSEPVVQAQLISRIEPRYPPLALQTRQQGTVILHAIISRDGRITALEVITGPPLFVQAALGAVRQWRYRPTMLSGEPLEVETTITVVFQLQP